MIREFNGIKPDVDKALFIAENAVIIGDVVLGEGTTVWYGAVLRGDTGAIRIGKNVNIQDNSVVHTEFCGKVEIDDNVTIGHSCIIHSCQIESNCMIGMGSTIMNDARIRKNSLVAAGSLVTERREFPEGNLIIGSPAKVLKKTTPEQIKYIEHSVKEYLALGKSYKEKCPLQYKK